MTELLKELKEAEALTAFIDNLWDQNPESEELEIAYDKAYKKEKEAFNKVAAAVSGATGLSLTSCAALLKLRREKVEEILEKL